VSAAAPGSKGVDVSTWQHPNGVSIDWHKVAAAGYTFAIVKASQGSTWVNPWLARDLDDARNAGLLVGAYHFYELGVNPEAQVDHAVNVLMGEVLELGFYLDWEVAELQTWQLPETYGTFMSKAMEARNPTGTYCDQSWYAQLKQSNSPIYRLWLAAYDPSDPVKSFLWQNSETGKVPGIQAPVDTDVLESTRGLNIHTAPKAAPTAATVHSVKATVEAEPEPNESAAWDLLAEHTPPEGAARHIPQSSDENE
jgi:lysozyme